MSPVIIDGDLPAAQKLSYNNIITMSSKRANNQDIRPLRIAILNLMPDKITTENQLLSVLSNSMIQVEITLLSMATHKSKTVSSHHLNNFYKQFNQVRDELFDALIITGAPIEHLPFEDVSYIEELNSIFEWAKTNVFTSLFICWGAQAALKYYYGIEKQTLSSKLFGVFNHTKVCDDPLFIGLNNPFKVCHSRNTQSDPDALSTHQELDILAISNEASIHLVASKDRTQLFMAGHPEYDIDTLLNEYTRDLNNNVNINLPQNYFKNDDPLLEIQVTWKSDASLFYMNWLNHYVYQATDYVLKKKY